ncbi:MAG: hypothetical protein ACI93T_002096 [Porticoccaceae bacterium]|jgi:hypothetical protein
MQKCECVICSNRLDFQLPDSLLDEFDAGKVVVFAGAGVSTENRNVLKQTFYESIAAELGERSSQKAFPELMSQFCGQPNGRLQLLERILARFQHIHSFRELEFTATAFHRSVSTLFMLDTIITTNWDTYFEDVCGAIPFVTDSDLAFWDSPQRKVLKIHGSVQNYGSIVATSEDYRGCESRLHTELIGSVLKTILATKTVIFVGYSLTDSDFQNVFAFVAKHMKGLNRQAYVINPFDSECRRFAEMGLIPIQTAASYFFDSVKAHYVESGRMYSDEIYGEAADQRDLVREEHEKLCERFSIHQFPQLIYALAYQDGLMHGFDRVGTHAGTGEYSHPCRIREVFSLYEAMQKKKRAARVYEDVAYIEGYVNAFIYLGISQDKHYVNETADDELIPHPPLYFAFGLPKEHSGRGEIGTLEEFEELVPELPGLHQASFKRAQRLADSLDEDMTFHHPPWL